MVEPHDFVDVWYGDILLDEADERYWSVLNEQERVKAQSFKRQDLQRKYIKTRAVLKLVLAGYLPVDAQQLSIATATYGKPYIRTQSPVYFNLSHQGNRFAIVVSNITEVGIDIEQYRDRKNMSALVGKCFSDQEAKFWLALPNIQQTKMFYWFWVRKEAFVKAVGRGIALGLNQCVVNPDKPSCFASIPSAYGLAENWKILDIPLNADEVCAVVLKTADAFEFKQTLWR